MSNLGAIVDDYIKRHRKGAEKELRWFDIQPSLAEAVYLAALAKGPSGKRLDHQRRLPQAVLEENRRRLLHAVERLECAISFEELFNTLESVIGIIKGIGELTVYDTALRIGAKLGVEPAHVYLHAGTRIGAHKLGIDSSQKLIRVAVIPEPLRKLKPREIEDVLCIYKEYLGSGRAFRGGGVSRCYG